MKIPRSALLILLFTFSLQILGQPAAPDPIGSACLYKKFPVVAGGINDEFFQCLLYDQSSN